MHDIVNLICGWLFFVYSYICACKWVKAFKDAHPPLPEMISKATCLSCQNMWIRCFRVTYFQNDQCHKWCFSSIFISLSLSLIICLQTQASNGDHDWVFFMCVNVCVLIVHIQYHEILLQRGPGVHEWYPSNSCQGTHGNCLVRERRKARLHHAHLWLDKKGKTGKQRQVKVSLKTIRRLLNCFSPVN